MKKETIVIFTDGSATVKPKKGELYCKGGAGVYIATEDLCIAKHFAPAKTGRMEAKAVLIALQQVKDDFEGTIQIYSDSMYMVNMITNKWLEKWEEEKWVNRKNYDVLKLILEEKRKKKAKVIITHVKSHRKDLDDDLIFGNAVADMLADYKNGKEYIYEDPDTWEKKSIINR